MPAFFTADCPLPTNLLPIPNHPGNLVQILADQQPQRTTTGVRTNTVANFTNTYTRVVILTNSTGTTKPNRSAGRSRSSPRLYRRHDLFDSQPFLAPGYFHMNHCACPVSEKSSSNGCQDRDPIRRNPAPGNHQEDIEARFLVGRGATLIHQHVFWDAEVAFRTRFGAPADQVRFDVTAGVDLSKHIMAMGQFFNTRSLRNGEPLDVVTNPNAQSDYDLHKCQVSAVIALPYKAKVQIGWTDTISGRNTARGQGAIISLWKAF